MTRKILNLGKNESAKSSFRSNRQSKLYSQIDGFRPDISKAKPAMTLAQQFYWWFINDVNQNIFLFLYIITTGVLFYITFTPFYVEGYRTGTMFAILDYTLPIAKGCAMIINFNCALVLFSVCRNVVTILRKTFLN
jgi:NADPH oxidase